MKKTVFIFLMAVSASLSQAQTPVFQWAKKMGSTGHETGRSIVANSSGDVYAGGYFNGIVDFDPGASTYTLSSVNGNGFLIKSDATGNFVWAKQLGGNVFSVALDISGNVYATGNFSGTTDFDPGAGTYTLSSLAGSYDIYVAKLDALGNFLWAKQMSGDGGERANSIALDALGNVYTTGTFADTVDFDPGVSTYTLASLGSSDVFVSKLDASGNFVWAEQMGGIGSGAAECIALDATGNPYLVGSFYGTLDFDPGAGTANLTSAGDADVFISKLDMSGNFVWGKQMGGSNTDYGLNVAVDGSGNVYTGGYSNGMCDYDPGSGTFNLTPLGFYDNFVSKLDASGNFVWATQIGGTSFDFAFGLSIDASGNVYTTGQFTGTVDFDPGAATFNLTTFGANDIYVSKLDASGNFVWATQFGGSSAGGLPYAVSVDASNNVYTTGGFQNTVDFDSGVNTFALTSDGQEDIFIHKMSQSGSAGLYETQELNNISIYPNPSHDYITIENKFALKDGVVSIIDIQGQIVLQEKMDKNKVRIDVSELCNGIYFLKLTDESGAKQRTARLAITH